MKILKLLPVFVFAFASCESDESREAPLGSYDNGILVLSEGDMLSGSVTYVSDNLQTVQQNIFSLVNPSQSMGGFVQSMFFHGDRAFLISNFANKITVVNRYTFEYIATITTGLDHPRYGTVMGGKAYVTNQATWDSTADDFVRVIDLTNLSVGESLIVGDYAERIVSENGKLYVSNGAFGLGEGFTIIDAASGNTTKINTGISPNSLEIEDNHLFVLCSTIGGTGKIVKFNLNTEAITEIPLPDTILTASNLDIEDDYMYFTAGGKVYKVPENATSVTDDPLFDTQNTSFYMGYGFAVEDGRVYITEAAADFVSDGSLYVYSTSGSFIKQIPTGVGPNGIYFND